MSKTLTKWIAGELSKRFKGIEGGVVIDFTGLDSETTVALRSAMNKEQIKIAVVKNTLACRALKDLGYKHVDKVFSGPSAVLYGGEGPSFVAKAILDWKKKTKAKNVEIKGGFLSGKALDKDQIDQLSKMPGRPQVLAMILGTLQAAARQVMTVVKTPAIQPLYAVRALTEKNPS